MIAVLTGCQFLDQLLGSDLSPLSSPIACLCDESVAVFQFPGEFVKSFPLSNKRAIVSRSGAVSVFWCDIVMEWELRSLLATPGPGRGNWKIQNTRHRERERRERAFQLVAEHWVWQLRPDKLDGGDLCTVHCTVYCALLYITGLWPDQPAIWVIRCHGCHGLGLELLNSKDIWKFQG